MALGIRFAAVAAMEYNFLLQSIKVMACVSHPPTAVLGLRGGSVSKTVAQQPIFIAPQLQVQMSTFNLGLVHTTFPTFPHTGLHTVFNVFVMCFFLDLWSAMRSTMPPQGGPHELEREA